MIRRKRPVQDDDDWYFESLDLTPLPTGSYSSFQAVPKDDKPIKKRKIGFDLEEIRKRSEAKSKEPKR